MDIQQIDEDIGEWIRNPTPGTNERNNGIVWRNFRLRHRRRMIASCIAEMPAEPSEDSEQREAWKLRSEEKCRSVLAILGAALLSWAIQKIIEWLYQRWKEKHQEKAEWHSLRTEACLALENDSDE